MIIVVDLMAQADLEDATRPRETHVFRRRLPRFRLVKRRACIPYRRRARPQAGTPVLPGAAAASDGQAVADGGRSHTLGAGPDWALELSRPGSPILLDPQA